MHDLYEHSSSLRHLTYGALGLRYAIYSPLRLFVGCFNRRASQYIFCNPGLLLTKTYLSHRVGSQVRYTPITRPDPPSLARQLAYQENSPLVGPEGDPEGWHNLPAIEVRGRIFSDRSISASVTVSFCLQAC